MKCPTFALVVAAVILLYGGAHGSARADIIYDNGPMAGDNGIFLTTNPVTDSFTVSDPSLVRSVTVGLWVGTNGEPGQPGSLNWQIGTSAFGNDVLSGSATDLNRSSTLDRQVLPFYNLYYATFPVNAPLAPGTYWLSLSNALDSTGGWHMAWDVNSGPSQAYAIDPTTGAAYSNPSNSFAVHGVIPEPTSFALCGLSAAAGLISYAQRRRRAIRR